MTATRTARERTRIQLALDLLDPDEALDVVARAGAHVDVVEVGTSLLKGAGLGVLDRVRELTGDTPVFVDTKIIDGPHREATLMSRVRPDYYSMLAVASDTAVRTVLGVAADTGSRVVFDLQSVPDAVARAERLADLGATAVCVHENPDCGADLRAGFAEARTLRERTDLEIFIAGGISLRTIGLVRDALRPDVVIVGGGILAAADPAEAAAAFRAALHPVAPNRPRGPM